MTLAQTNLTGVWGQLTNHELYEQGPGPDLGAYMGVPLNNEGRSAALAWGAEMQEELHRQCAPYLANYLMFSGVGRSSISIWATTDPLSGSVVAWHIGGNSIDRLPITIWMDGRTPPPLALHTYSGYATGKWEGHTLVATLTHLKDGVTMRNGVPASNKQTIKLFIERTGEVLTITALIRDPVYFEATLPVAQSWQLDSTGTFSSDVAVPTCIPAETISNLSDGYHWSSQMPATSAARMFMNENYNIPVEAAMGGEATMYPEFRKRMRNRYTPPLEYCKIGCCDAVGPFPPVCNSIQPQ